MPGLTELVCALGLERQLVGRSHACDYPESVTDLPVLTSVNYSDESSSQSNDIHESVTRLLQKSLSIYDVDEELLKRLNPGIILTQDHCEVCAVSFDELHKAVRNALGDNTQVLSVSPSTLQGIFKSFQDIADALGVSKKGRDLVVTIQNRFDDIQDRTKELDKPSVVALEWLDPLMSGGNWMPEMIKIAGGVPYLAEAGKHSPWCTWDDIHSLDPDILLVVPCGYGINKTMGEMSALTKNEGWKDLAAVKNNQVYILDGNHYFNRPGPRIKTSVEILAEIFHPEEFDRHHEKSGLFHYQSI